MKKVFKTRCKIEENFVFLEIFLKQVLHHLIVLKEQDSEVIFAWFIIFLLKLLIRVDPVRASLVSLSHFLGPFIPIDIPLLLWLLFQLYLFIHVLAACILKEAHSLLTNSLLLLIKVLRRLRLLCLNRYLNYKHSPLAELRYYRDLPAHHTHKFIWDPEAQTRSTILRLNSLIRLWERFEEFFYSILADTNTRIYHFDH